MVVDWPRPNAFLAAVALGALEQLAVALERQLPFLRELVRELGAAVYANADELAALAAGGSSRLPLLFDRGRLWFQELAGERQRVHTLRCATRASEDEVARLSELMQEQHAARAVERVQHRVQLAADAARRRSQHGDELGGQSTLPLLSRLLRPRDGRAAVSDDWLDAHGGFQLFSVEVRRVFEALGDAEALKLTRALLEAGADRQLPLLGEALAVGVDQLAEPARREFLREYFAFIESDELQAALRHRDERNNDRRLEELVAELVDALKLHGGGGGGNGDAAAPQSGTATFHSDEARVLKRALDQRELLEDVAAELAFLDDAASAALPERLRSRLRPYETAAKRVAKAQELMARASSARPVVPVVVPVVQPAAPVCGCACGHHRLVSAAAAARLDALDAADSLDPPAALEPEPPETKPVDPSQGVDSEQRKARRRSTARRPQSAGARRKNGVNFGSQLAARRGSVTGGAPRLFPLAEVCHLLAAAVQLQFSRDAAEEAAAVASASASASAASTAALEGVSLLAGDGRWAFLRRRAPPFKALARDLLVRRYGIRSIAAMHALQLERSLAHYAADGHARCELFAWFLGAADPRRAASRDHAFRFFQRLVKAVMRLCAARRPAPPAPPSPAKQQQQQPQEPALAFSAVVAAWSESIGDGDGPATGPGAKLLAAPLALEALRHALPEAMRLAAEVAALQQRLHRAGLERKPVEVELFLRRAMDAWQRAFEPLAAAVEATLAREPRLDVAGFGRCLAAHGLELSTGERLELFDLLARDADEDARDAGVLGSRQLARFVLEAQYLRAGS